MEQEQVTTEQEQINPADVATSVEAEVEVVESASTETDETAPTDSGEAPKRNRVQERIDELTRKNYEALSEKEYWRGKAESLMKPVEEVKPVQEKPYESPVPRQEDFETYEQYDEAMFNWRYERRAHHERAQREQAERSRVESEAAQRQREWLDAGESKYADFKTVTQSSTLEITMYMAGAIQDSEMGHDVAYYLGQHPKEASRIARLNPVTQVREIAKLEFKLQSPAQKADTKAPTPTQPVGGKEAPAAKLEDMSYEDYKAYRMRQIQGQSG